MTATSTPPPSSRPSSWPSPPRSRDAVALRLGELRVLTPQQVCAHRGERVHQLTARDVRWRRADSFGGLCVDATLAWRYDHAASHYNVYCVRGADRAGRERLDLVDRAYGCTVRLIGLIVDAKPMRTKTAPQQQQQPARAETAQRACGSLVLLVQPVLPGLVSDPPALAARLQLDYDVALDD